MHFISITNADVFTNYGYNVTKFLLKLQFFRLFGLWFKMCVQKNLRYLLSGPFELGIS